jgi:hypothetical protein
MHVRNVNARHTGLGTQSARPQDGHPNAKRHPQVGCPAMQRKARPQVGQRNVRHIRKLGARPNTNTRHVRKVGLNARHVRKRKHPHKGALGLKTSWRMDKNKFLLGGRLFNTASPRLGTPMQRRACPQVGHPNATQGTSASWAPQCNARHSPQVGRPNTRPQRKRKAPLHVRKLGAATQRKARPQDGRPNAKLICNKNVHTKEH